jgi:hypothetical protein
MPSHRLFTSEFWGEGVFFNPMAHGVALAKAYGRERGYSLNGFIKRRGNKDQQ